MIVLKTGLHEECGVFGVYSPQTTDVAAMTYVALYALQHRGQESCGIVVNDRGVFSHHKDLGLVPEVFNRSQIEKLGQGNISIGHVRYSTTGKPSRSNAQPIVVRHVKGPMSIAHNGNLVNAHELRRKYELRGAIFHTTNDTEVISYAVTEQRLERSSIEEAVEYAMYDLKGAYSLVVMSPQKLIAARDPNGFLSSNGNWIPAKLLLQTATAFALSGHTVDRSPLCACLSMCTLLVRILSSMAVPYTMPAFVPESCSGKSIR